MGQGVEIGNREEKKGGKRKGKEREREEEERKNKHRSDRNININIWHEFCIEVFTK